MWGCSRDVGVQWGCEWVVGKWGVVVRMWGCSGDVWGAVGMCG